MYRDGVGRGHCVLICNIDEDDEGNVGPNARAGTASSTREMLGSGRRTDIPLVGKTGVKMEPVESIAARQPSRTSRRVSESIATRSRRMAVKARATATALLPGRLRTQACTAEERVISRTVSADACIWHKWLDINMRDKRNERRRYIARVNKIR